MKAAIAILVVIVPIVLIGVVSAVVSPDQASTILSFTGTLAVAVAALVRKQVDLTQEQAKMHELMNSRFDEHRELIANAEWAKGAKAGRERMLAEIEDDEKKAGQS